jgi:E3 ubiquitin-protein ligase RBBP6
VDKITKSSNLSTSYGTEDEKIKAMMSQSTQEYDPSKYVKNRGIVGPLPSNYTCYRCGQPGHYIKQCPTNNSDVKRSTGIPRSFMIPAKADQKGALLTASGDYAVPIIDQ